MKSTILYKNITPARKHEVECFSPEDMKFSALRELHKKMQAQEHIFFTWEADVGDIIAGKKPREYGNEKIRIKSTLEMQDGRVMSCIDAEDYLTMTKRDLTELRKQITNHHSWMRSEVKSITALMEGRDW